MVRNEKVIFDITIEATRLWKLWKLIEKAFAFKYKKLNGIFKIVSFVAQNKMIIYIYFFF